MTTNGVELTPEEQAYFRDLYGRLNQRLTKLTEILEANQVEYPADLDGLYAIGAMFVGASREYGLSLQEIQVIVDGFYEHTKPEGGGTKEA